MDTAPVQQQQQPQCSGTSDRLDAPLAAARVPQMAAAMTTTRSSSTSSSSSTHHSRCQNHHNQPQQQQRKHRSNKPTHTKKQQSQQQQQQSDGSHAKHNTKHNTKGNSSSRPRKLKQPRTHDMPRILAEILREPKQALLHRVVRIIGPKAAWDLLKETVRVEQCGGQRVNALGSGAPDKFLEPDAQTPRKRTTGGIYFTLLKDAVPKETYREIYEVESKKKREFKKRVRHERKQRFEGELAQLGFDVLHLDNGGEAAAAAGETHPVGSVATTAATAATTAVPLDPTSPSARGSDAAAPAASATDADREEGEVEDMELA